MKNRIFDPQQGVWLEEESEWDTQNGRPVRRVTNTTFSATQDSGEGTGNYYEGAQNFRSVSDFLDAKRRGDDAARRTGRVINPRSVEIKTPLAKRKHIPRYMSRLDPSPAQTQEIVAQRGALPRAQLRPDWSSQNIDHSARRTMAEGIIIRQASIVEAQIRNEANEQARLILQKSGPNVKAELAMLEAHRAAMITALGEVTRSSGLRVQMAKDLARSVGTQTPNKVVDRARLLIRAAIRPIEQNINTQVNQKGVMGTYPDPAHQTTVGRPPMDDEDRGYHEKLMKSLGANKTRGSVSQGHAEIKDFTFNRQVGSEETVDAYIDLMDNIAKGIGPRGSTVTPQDQARAKSISGQLRKLKADWKDDRPASMQTAPFTRGADVVAVIQKEANWVLDTLRTTVGVSTWEQGSRSHDPEVRSAFARTGIGSADVHPDEQKEVKGRQDQVDRFLTGRIRMSDKSMPVSRSTLFAARTQKAGSADYSGKDHQGSREQEIRDWLQTPTGQEIRKRYRTEDEAIKDLHTVMHYRANMQGAFVEADARDIRKQGGKPTGLEAGLDYIPEQNKPWQGEAFISPDNLRSVGAIKLPSNYKNLGEVVRDIEELQRRGVNVSEMYPELIGAISKAYGERQVSQIGMGTEKESAGELGAGAGGGEAGYEGDIGQSNPQHGKTGLVKDEAEYASTRAQTYRTMRHYWQTKVMPRMESAKFVQIWRTMSAVAQETEGSATTDKIIDSVEQRLRVAEVAMLRDLGGHQASKVDGGTYRGDGKPRAGQFLGTNASTWSLIGSSQHERTFFSDLPGETRGPKVVRRRTVGGRIVTSEANLISNPAEDYRREQQTEMGVGALSREDALILGGSMSMPPQLPPGWNEMNLEKKQEWMSHNMHRELPESPYGALHPAARGAQTPLGLNSMLASSTRERFGDRGGSGAAPGYESAINAAIRIGDDALVNTLVELQKRSRDISPDIEMPMMGKGLIAGASKPVTHFLPFNSLFAAFDPTIQSDPSMANVKRSSGYGYYQRLLEQEFGSMDRVTSASDFLGLWQQRSGIKHNEQGQAVNAMGEIIGDITGKDLTKMFAQTFQPELINWAHEIGIKPDDKAAMDKLAHKLVHGGALEDLLGGQTLTGAMIAKNLAGGARPPLFGEGDETEFHKGDALFRNMKTVMNDMFGIRRKNTDDDRFANKDDILPYMGQQRHGPDEKVSSEQADINEYAKNIGDLREEYGMWTPEREARLHIDRTYDNKAKALERQRRMYNLGRGMTAVQGWLGRAQQSNIGGHGAGLLIEAGISNEDKYEVLSAQREKRQAEHEHIDLQTAAPTLHQYLTGAVAENDAIRDVTQGYHAPPGERALEMSMVLNAAFEAIASQGVVRRGSEQVQGHQFDENLTAFRSKRGSGANTNTMTRDMIWGESTWSARNNWNGKKGVGLAGIETAEDAKRFQDVYFSLLKQFHGHKQDDALGFDAADLRKISDVMGWDYEGIDKSDPNLPSNLLANKTGKVRIIDPLMKDKSKNYIAVGGSTFAHVGDRLGHRDNLLQYRSGKSTQVDERVSLSSVSGYSRRDIKGIYQKYFDVENPDSMLGRTLAKTRTGPQGGKRYVADTRLGANGILSEAMRAGMQQSKAGSRWGEFKDNFRERLRALHGDDSVADTSVRNGGFHQDWDMPGHINTDLLSKRATAEMKRMNLGTQVTVLNSQDPEAAGARGRYYLNDDRFNVHLPAFGDLHDQAKAGTISNRSTWDTIAKTVYHEAFHAMSFQAGFTHDEMAAINDLAHSMPADELQGKTLYEETYENYSRPELYGGLSKAQFDRYMASEVGAKTFGRYAKWRRDRKGEGRKPRTEGERLLSDLYEGKIRPGQGLHTANYDGSKVFHDQPVQRGGIISALNALEGGSRMSRQGANDPFVQKFLSDPHNKQINVGIDTMRTMSKAAIGYQMRQDQLGALLGNPNNTTTTLSGAQIQAQNHAILSQTAAIDELHGPWMDTLMQGPLLSQVPPAPTPNTGGSGRGSGGTPPPPHNPSDQYPFWDDHDETVSSTDWMLQALVQFAHRDNEPLFMSGGYSPMTNSDISQVHGSWTDAQKHAIGMGHVEGGAPKVLTGNPGSGKTRVEIGRVLHRMNEPGMSPEDAPVLTSFAKATMKVSEDRMKDAMDQETFKRYKAGGGISTIHSLGMGLLGAMGWSNVFGSAGQTGTDVNGDPIFSGRHGHIEHSDPDSLAHTDIGKLMEQDGSGRWVVRHGAEFTHFEQASKAHQFEMFRESLGEVWNDELHRSNHNPQQNQILQYARGSMPLEWDANGNQTVKRGRRADIRDKDRPWAAIAGEIKGTKEERLWKNVQMLGETGIHHDVLKEFFDPTRLNASGYDHYDEFRNQISDMWLASHVLGKMDERAQRGTIQTVQDEEGKDELGLVRHYLPWDLVNKPLQHIEKHSGIDLNTGREEISPEIKNQLAKYYGREYIVSEAQDANLAQLKLIKLLAGGWENSFLSGDPKQDLYPWRGGTRRWLKMATSAAKQAGSYAHLAETHRFTGGTAEFLNQMYENTVFIDKAGQRQRVMPEAPLRAVGQHAGSTAGTVAVEVHPFGANNEQGGQWWEREVMAQQVRHQTGLGIDDSAYTKDQAFAMREAIQRTGTSAGGATAGDFMVVARSNKDVANITEAYRSKGILAMPRFATEKMEEWKELSGAASAYDNDRIDELLAGRVSDIAGDDFVKSMAGPGRYHGNAGIRKMLEDVKDARRNLNLHQQAMEEIEAISKATGKEFDMSKHVLIGTIPGMKGDERKFVQVPDALERTYKMGTADDVIEGRESFVELHNALTRGAQGFLYGRIPTLGERKKYERGGLMTDLGKIFSSMFTAAQNFADNGHTGDLMLAGGHVRQAPTPQPSGGFASNPNANLRSPRRLGAGQYGAFFAGGEVANDYDKVVVGEGGPEIVVHKNGKAKKYDHPAVLDVKAEGGLFRVLSAEETRKAEMNGLMGNKMGSAAFGGGFKDRFNKFMYGAPPVMEDLSPQAVAPSNTGMMAQFGHEDTAKELANYLKTTVGADVSLHSDNGSHVVKATASSDAEQKLLKTALLAWEGQVNTGDNTKKNKDTYAFDPSHQAYDGKVTGDMLKGSGSGAKAFSDTVEGLKKMTEPLEEAGKKVTVFNRAMGDAEKAVAAATKAHGVDAQGLLNTTATHHAMAQLTDAQGQPVMSHANLMKNVADGGAQIGPSYDPQTGTRREFNQHTGQMEIPELGRRAGSGWQDKASIPGAGGGHGGGGGGGFAGGPGRGLTGMVDETVNMAWKYNQIMQPFQEFRQNEMNVYQAKGTRARAVNYAIGQGGFLPDPGSSTFGGELKGFQDFVVGSFNSNKEHWQDRGITGAQYARNAGVYMAAGQDPFSQQAMSQINQVASDAQAAGKTGDEIGKAVTDWLNNTSDGKQAKSVMDQANTMSFVGGQLGVAPDNMIRMVRQMGSASGVSEQGSDYSTATMGILANVARQSPIDIDEFMQGMKYIAPQMAPMLSGKKYGGGEYGDAESMGLSLTKADGTAKTKDELERERTGLVRTAEIATVIGGGVDRGLTSEQMGRAMRSTIQSQYSMTDRQSWLYAKQTGVIDEKGTLLNGANGSPVGTADPQVYRSLMSQANDRYSVTQMESQLKGTAITAQSLNIETKSLNLKAESVALEAKKYAEQAPIQKDLMQAQNNVSNMSYAASLRSQGAALSMQPLEREVFQANQSQQVNELARTQRSVAASRAYDEVINGPIGANRSYGAYSAVQANQLAQGQGSQNIGNYGVQAAVSAVGLEAAQTYRGLDYQQQMLGLGQSQLNSGASYAAQMKYIQDQKGFAETKFGAEGDLKQTQRSIEDEQLKERAELLPKVLELERQRFDESQRSAQEQYAITVAQGQVIKDNNALFESNMKYYDAEVAQRTAEYDIMKEQIDNQKELNELRKQENEELKTHLEEIIPLQKALNAAMMEWINGSGANVGRTDLAGNDPETGYQDPSSYITEILSAKDGESQGDAFKKLIAMFGDDMTAAPAGSYLAEIYQAGTSGDQRQVDKAIQDILDHPEKLVQAIDQAQGQTTDAKTDLNVGASGEDALAEGKISEWAKAMADDTEAFKAHTQALTGNLGSVGALFEGLGGGLAMSIATQVLKGLMGPKVPVPPGTPVPPGGGAVVGTVAKYAAPVAVGYGLGWGVDKVAGHYGYNTNGYGKAIGTGAGIGASIGMAFGPVGMAVGAVAGGAVGAGVKYGADHWDEIKDFTAKVGKIAWHELIDPFVNAYKSIKTTWDFIAGIDWGFIKTYATATFDGFKKSWEELKMLIGGAWDGIKAGASATLGGFKESWDELTMLASGAWDGIKTGVSATFEGFKKSWDEIKMLADGAWEGIKTAMSIFWDGMTGFIGTIQEVGSGAWDAIKEQYTQTWDGLSAAFVYMRDTLGNAWGTIKEGIDGTIYNLTYIFGQAKDILSGAWDSIYSSVTGFFDAFLDGLKGLWEKAKEKLPSMPDWADPRNLVPGHATGTSYAMGGLSLVGEHGPEFMNIARGAEIIPAGSTRSMIQQMSDMVRNYAPSRDMRIGANRSIQDMDLGRDRVFNLHPTTARNMSEHRSNTVEVNITIESGAQVDEALLARLKAETIREIRKVLED